MAVAERLSVAYGISLIDEAIPTLTPPLRPRPQDGSPTPSSSRNADSSKADDSAVSFFGQSQAFDGLGIVFDTSPSAPLIKRSDPAGWQFGADTSGVISALIDDGKTGKNWFDNDYRKDAKRDPAAEAAYLDRAVGECEAAFRNAPGLVWVRISHFDKQIRVGRIRLER